MEHVGDRDRVKALAAKGQRHVTYKEGVAWAKKIGAVAYVFSKRGARTGECFRTSTERALQRERRDKEKGETEYMLLERRSA